MKKLLLFPFGLIWLAGAVLLGHGIYALFTSVFLEQWNEYAFLSYGFGAFIITIPLIPPRKYQFWNTLLHEFAHALFAALTFSKPVELRAGARSTDGAVGHLVHQSRQSGPLRFVRDHLVALAPYYFPTTTLPLIGVYLLLTPQRQGLFSATVSNTPAVNGVFALVGFSYAYHLIIHFFSATPRQSDFNALGYFYGLMFTLFMQALFLTGIMVAVSYHHNAWQLLQETLQKSLEFYLRFEW